MSLDDQHRHICTTSGRPIDEHTRDIDPQTGMQKDYLVLCAHERAKPKQRPVRDTYRHATCGRTTTMSRLIAETYARDPTFYTHTFCTTCRVHVPVSECTWPDGSVVGS